MSFNRGLSNETIDYRHLKMKNIGIGLALSITII